MKGNKGEWSEIYTLIKLLGDKKIHSGDPCLQTIESSFYPILRILRHEKSYDVSYTYDDDVVIVDQNAETLKIPLTKFKEQSLLVLNKIKESKTTTFEIEEIESFLHSLKCISIKSASNVKSDINIIIHDSRTNQTPQLGFSIKSQLGNPATLLNAGKTTNFIYSIKNINLSDNEIDQINNINSHSKIKDRIETLVSQGATFEFFQTEKQTFSNNLTLIDSALPDIFSHLLLDFYTSPRNQIKELVNKLEHLNPLKYDQSSKHTYYEYKLKRFLTDTALGMMPSVIWDGQHQATGGYLLVKENGDILCYHIYNKNIFEDYLLSNTKLDTASSTRHDFGKIYRKDDQLHLKLNLQIRFLK